MESADAGRMSTSAGRTLPNSSVDSMRRSGTSTRSTIWRTKYTSYPLPLAAGFVRSKSLVGISPSTRFSSAPLSKYALSASAAFFTRREPASTTPVPTPASLGLVRIEGGVPPRCPEDTHATPKTAAATQPAQRPIHQACCRDGKCSAGASSGRSTSEAGAIDSSTARIRQACCRCAMANSRHTP